MNRQEFRILVVDDDPVIREFVTAALAAEGNLVATASNGVEALAMVEEAQPDLVLLDVQMPAMDGPALVSALRRKGIHLTVLVMSAVHPTNPIVSELGARGFLAKPFDLDQLLGHIQQIYAEWSETSRPAEVSEGGHPMTGAKVVG